MPETTYKQILANHNDIQNPNEIYDSAINSGISEPMAAYMKAFAFRISGSPHLSYDDAIAYCDLFMANVENQSNFTPVEKYNMTAVISIYKNSLKYWSYTFKSK